MQRERLRSNVDDQMKAFQATAASAQAEVTALVNEARAKTAAKEA